VLHPLPRASVSKRGRAGIPTRRVWTAARAGVVAVPPERDAEPVRVFETFTPNVHALVDWLVTCPLDTVVMEATGV
jgi:hypothetical protein